ncbi:MAG: Spy/CpxP family protein refolding chaperone [Rhodoblastus sp.]|nr:Spy/CpxP family protein refolding chaperone [Rhodoblastus sp.]MCC2100978.1 Spy/CpxP family protein refolding chaperone [Hyphomicrobiales bacterium]
MSRFFTAAAFLSLALIGTQAQAQPAQTTPGGAGGGRGARMIERFCGAMKPAQAWGRYAERLSDRLALDEKQKGLLRAWQEARIKAREDSRTAQCSPKPNLSTFQGRLDWRQKRLEAQLASFKATRAPLEAFYAGLSDQQKANWDAYRDRRGDRRRYRRGD